MSGMVYLVGAGPGDPELLTVKALRILGIAEVVLTDALISPEVRALIPSAAITLDVGKQCGKRCISQAEINFLLVHHANSGKIVVRLKSGDPLVFGRAGEEMEALRNAGIPFEVIPGITAALGAAAISQIPLTDRRFASRLVFATAQRARGKPAPDSRALASQESTIIFYMPKSNYSAIANELLQGGMPGETPCIVVSKACGAEQQFYPTRLRELPKVPVLPSPALVIVGRVTAHHLQNSDQDRAGRDVCKGLSFDAQQTYLTTARVEATPQKEHVTSGSEISTK